ncbi:family 43 glycosylhydrolase [uncultured Bacteroides sp.]|uniref:family 43 glycosylhydrolase n=1 Tax=uncultured Bacteroides sp. TaxID=162156 RepID=UPI002AA6BEE2|nr:family 43 glycosylhydrolase [uncultured Bacteroides sp.]
MEKNVCNRICLFVLLTIMALPASLRAQEWKLVWSDEFNNTGKPDNASWSFEQGFVRNEELQWYQGDNAYCKDGVLVIEGRKEKVLNDKYHEGSNNWKNSRKYAEYTSSSIKTVGKRAFLYGRFEVRAKIPIASGSWPAIWTLGTGMEWPSCGEIDMMEFYRILGVPHILANVAWGTDIMHQAKWNSKKIPFTHFTEKDADWASKFHVWRMDWDETAIKLYLDDELLNEVPLSETVNGSFGNNKNPFKQPHYLLLNLALGGANGGVPDESAFPMKYEIDYVRVYQKKQTTIRSGELWPDNNGVHINAHGGGILHHQGKYYWFGEYKSASTSSALVGVTCYSSKDLCNWTNEGIALAVSNDVKSDIVKGCILERPKVIYNEKTKKFVMWFHLELKGKGYAAARAAVAVSDHATGPYHFVRSFRSNPGIYPFDMSEEARKLKLNVADYKEWWTPSWYDAVTKGLFVKRDLEQGQMSRDMTLFVDDDGKAYHIYASEENLTIQIAELNGDYTGYTGKYVRVAPAGHNEAPAMFKRNGTYWMITSGCTGWAPNEARMFSAPSIWGPWTKHPNPCIGKQAEITFGGQSTYILTLPGVKDNYIFMADIWRPKNPIDARYIWLPIQFDKDGTPFLKWQDEWTPCVPVE